MYIPECPVDNVSIGSGDDLMPNRGQAINLANYVEFTDKYIYINILCTNSQ